MDKKQTDKPKRTYTRRKPKQEAEPEKLEIIKEEENKENDEIIINYPNINNIEHPALKDKIFKVLKGIF